MSSLAAMKAANEGRLAVSGMALRVVCATRGCAAVYMCAATCCRAAAWTAAPRHVPTCARRRLTPRPCAAHRRRSASLTASATSSRSCRGTSWTAGASWLRARRAWPCTLAARVPSLRGASAPSFALTRCPWRPTLRVLVALRARQVCGHGRAAAGRGRLVAVPCRRRRQHEPAGHASGTAPTCAPYRMRTAWNTRKRTALTPRSLPYAAVGSVRRSSRSTMR